MNSDLKSFLCYSVFNTSNLLTCLLVNLSTYTSHSVCHKDWGTKRRRLSMNELKRYIIQAYLTFFYYLCKQIGFRE